MLDTLLNWSTEVPIGFARNAAPMNPRKHQSVGKLRKARGRTISEMTAATVPAMPVISPMRYRISAGLSSAGRM